MCQEGSVYLPVSTIDTSHTFILFFFSSLQGNYACIVEWDDVEKPVALSHFLEVHVPPSVQVRGADKRGVVEVVEGTNATLECEAKEGTPLPRIQWVSESFALCLTESFRGQMLHSAKKNLHLLSPPPAFPSYSVGSSQKVNHPTA